MKKKIDFTLFECHDYKIIFRFYPRNTHVHGFHDEPPKTWDNVFKVYYSWAIIKTFKNYDGSINKSGHSHDRLLDVSFDECSPIPNLSAAIKYAIKTGKTVDERGFGQPTSDWRINPDIGPEVNDIRFKFEYYHFTVFNTWTDRGFRFFLDKDKTLKFCQYLDTINQYALDHSEGI